MLVGEPETAFPLRTRSSMAGAIGVAITALLAAIVGFLAWRGRGRGREPSGTTSQG